MRVWLINPYGPLPGEAWRETRFSVLGRALADRGHEVVWWTAAFCHHSKHVRSPGWKTIEHSPGFTIHLVPTPSYRRHIGIKRLRFEIVFALALFWKGRRAAFPPGVIISADIAMLTARVAVLLADRFKASLIFDIIDLWPEIFAKALPEKLHLLGEALASPLMWARGQNFRKANGITAVSPSYLAVAKGQRRGEYPKCSFRTVFWGCSRNASLLTDTHPLAQWRGRLKVGVTDVVALYAGTLGSNYDIVTLLEASRILSSRHSRIKVIIAGGGPQSGAVRRFLSQHESINAIYLGEVGAIDLAELSNICHIGICAYSKRSLVAMPIKFYDYIASGLAIVNSLPGDIAHFVKDNGIGVSYQAGDPESLAISLDRLASDDALRAGMAWRAKELAGRFNQIGQYWNFVEFIENVASERQ